MTAPRPPIAPHRPRTPRQGERGIALLNALVIVAALAAVAATLMLLAGFSRERQFLMQTQGQAGLYLDAAGQLSLLLLREDMVTGPASDHLNEIWALPRRLDIDRGEVDIVISDLQGRFNVNWLADPADLAARAAFGRLLAALDLPQALGGAVAALVTGRPPLTLIEEIARAPGMTADSFARLGPHLAALPPETRLNPGTATAPVLAAILPGSRPATIEALLAARAADPFASVADFSARAERLTGRAAPRPDDPAAFGPPRLGLTSRWFSVTMVARLDDARRARQLVVGRDAAQGTALITARLEEPR